MALDDSPFRGQILMTVDAALRAADPARAVLNALEAKPITGRVRVVAFGKASVAMMYGFLCAKRRGVADALVVAPHAPGLADGLDPRLKRGLRGVRFLRADHPLPGRRNVVAARAVADLARRCGPRESLVVLISGGGSAHLTLPAPGLALTDIRAVTSALLRAGAAIEELNTVRKHAEQLKGGGLARLLHERVPIHTLIVSDVLGDPLDAIASGPTSPDPTTYSDALAVLKRYRALDAAPRLTAHLRAGVRGAKPETTKPGDPIFRRVTHRIVANNASALAAAAEAARDAGLNVLSVEGGVRGEAADFGRRLAAAAAKVARSRAGRPACLLFGGETTVTVGESRGVGGRNTEAALAAAIGIAGMRAVAIVTFATDGGDGMRLNRRTTPAGAIVTGATCAGALARGLNARRALDEHNAHRFFQAAGNLLVTGPTGTNVNDIAMVIVG